MQGDVFAKCSFKVKFKNGRAVLGNKVSVVMTSYDLTRARIAFRAK
ncbi:translation initiation factor IF-1 [Methylophilus sp. 5]